MGVIYSVFPLESHGELADWLREIHVSIPDCAKPGRWPTLDEIRSVLTSLTGYSIESSDELDWFIYESAEAREGFYGGHSTNLICRPIDDSEDSYDFYFSKGSPLLALTVLERLAKVTGFL